MGCCGSKKIMVRGVPADAYFMKVVLPDVEDILDLIDFTPKEAGALFNIFTTIDEDTNHDVSLKEFYKHFKIKKSMFSDRVFGVLDRDGSGELDFKEFMIGIWNFCTLDARNLIRFSFGMYDLKGRGYLTMGQCSSLLRMMYNTKNISPKLQKILEGADSDGDGQFSLDEWFALSQQHPQLMAPARAAQKVVITKTFGVGFWGKKTKFRNKKYGLDDVFRIIETHNREEEEEAKAKQEAEDKAAQEEEEAERAAEEARMKAEREAAAEEWDRITEVEREEIEGKKECDRLKEAADEIYAAAPYHDTPMAMLDDPVLSKALSHLEDMLLELLPKLDIAFENRLKRESQAIVERTKIEVEDFYASKKGRRMLKIQVADKKKNSHMYTAKEMKKDYVQKEYLAIKTENRLKKLKKGLVKQFKEDLNKYEDMLDGLMIDYGVDDGEVNEDVWERHFDHEHGRFMWLCPVTGVTLYTVPIQGQEDPDYDAMLPYRRYHKDDIYAKMAIEEADGYTQGSRSVADDGASTAGTTTTWDDDTLTTLSLGSRKRKPKTGRPA